MSMKVTFRTASGTAGLLNLTNCSATVTATDTDKSTATATDTATDNPVILSSHRTDKSPHGRTCAPGKLGPVRRFVR